MADLGDVAAFATPLVALGLAATLALAARPSPGRLALVQLGGLGAALAVGLVGYASGRLSYFGPMSLLCAQLFLLAPLHFLVVTLAGGRGRAPRALRALGALLALSLAAVGTQAFLWEPRALVIDEQRLPIAGLQAPLRVLLIADVQTDRVGPYESRVFAQAAALRPDLVVFTGDHVQLPDGPAHAREAQAHARALRESGLSARLGMFAVRGDIDAEAWPLAFEETGARIVHESTRFDLGPVILWALSPEDSRARRLPVVAETRPVLVMGHSPDFALAEPPAQLLLAGHTHGGQVVLPLLGPPLTLTKVPRAWASGLTALPWGGWLRVSRGVGLERKDAPRLRFLCRPELALLELVPAAP